jgi:CRP-like cAMP-binding protein
LLENLAFRAFVFGIISAVSLPLGALTSKFWKPKDRIEAFLIAFGGGALLAALTIDLVGDALERGNFYPLALGCILGGLFFVGLNHLINTRGGFLRKAATTNNYLRRKKICQFKHIFQKLSQIPLFHQLPPEEIQALIPYVSSRTYQKGSTLLRQDEPGDSLFIIESGEIDIVDVKNNMRKIATLKRNDVVGEMALVTGEPRSATAVSSSDAKVWIILKEHFDLLLQNSPKLAEAVKTLVSERIADLQQKQTIDPGKAKQWERRAIDNLNKAIAIPTDTEIKEEAAAHGGAPLAIWLGILLDGIPESLVIGASLLHAPISFSLIAGLFLSNYPEALSSSVGMRKYGFSFLKIFMMWFSLMVITGIGAFFGNIFFVGVPDFLFALIEGMAAGAMLTMIAQTMMPEAFSKGGAISGFSTLLGFLAAIFFKTLE